MANFVTNARRTPKNVHSTNQSDERNEKKKHTTVSGRTAHHRNEYLTCGDGARRNPIRKYMNHVCKWSAFWPWLWKIQQPSVHGLLCVRFFSMFDSHECLAVIQTRWINAVRHPINIQLTFDSMERARGRDREEKMARKCCEASRRYMCENGGCRTVFRFNYWWIWWQRSRHGCSENQATPFNVVACVRTFDSGRTVVNRTKCRNPIRPGACPDINQPEIGVMWPNRLNSHRKFNNHTVKLRLFVGYPEYT